MQQKINQLKSLILNHKLPPALLLAIHTQERSVPAVITNDLKELCNFILCTNKNSCNDAACGSCQSCYLFSENLHPDFFYMAPELNRQITIDTARDLIEFMHYAPSLAEDKVILGIDLEKMNLATANALLKALEDLPKHVVMLYATTNKMQLIPTILSRLVLVDIHRESYLNLSTTTLTQDLTDLLSGKQQDLDVLISKWLESYPQDLLNLLYIAINNLLKVNFRSKKLWALLDDIIELNKIMTNIPSLNLNLHLYVALNKLGD